MNDKSVEALASLLHSLRQSNTRMPRPPHEMSPQTADEAFRVQDALTGLLGLPVDGWKVGLAPDRFTCAPIYRPHIYESGASVDAALVPDLRAEAEVAFVLGQDLPPREGTFSMEEVMDAIATAHPAMEIGSSRFVEFMELTMEEKIADNMGNGIILYGPAFSDWRAIDRANLAMEMRVNGQPAVRKRGGNSAGDPLNAMVALANHARGRGGLRAGQVVITGSVMGFHEVEAGDEVDVTFENLGEVSVKFL